MRRFLLHVLPGGFHRIRHYGLLANAGRREHLARARELLHVVPTATESQPPVAPVANVQPTFVCPHCGAAMIIVEIFARGRTDPCAAHIASRSMITGTGCRNAPSALASATADSGRFALRCRNVISRPLRHPSTRPRRVTIRHRRDVTRRSADPNRRVRARPRALKSP